MDDDVRVEAVKNPEEEADAALATLTQALARAAEQRSAAEKLADEARRLEVALTADARRARRAADEGLAQEVQQALDEARSLEGRALAEARKQADEQAGAGAKRAAAERRKAAWDKARQNFSAEVTEAERRLNDARRQLEHATVAAVEAARCVTEGLAQEDAARARTAGSLAALELRRAARERLEGQLRAIRARLADSEDPGDLAAQAGVSQEPRTAAAANGAQRRHRGVPWLFSAALALAALVALVHSLLPPATLSATSPQSRAGLVTGSLPLRPAPRHLPAAARPFRGSTLVRLAAFQVSPRTSWSVGSAAPNFLLFSLLPKKVRAGETATLCISVDHAKKLYVSGLGTFNPKLTTCRTFAPKRTTSFVAYVLNARGQRTKRRVTVVVERTVFVEEPLYKSRRLHRRRIAL